MLNVAKWLDTLKVRKGFDYAATSLHFVPTYALKMKFALVPCND